MKPGPPRSSEHCHSQRQGGCRQRRDEQELQSTHDTPSFLQTVSVRLVVHNLYSVTNAEALPLLAPASLKQPRLLQGGELTVQPHDAGYQGGGQGSS
jgi:hypothetical protein